MYNADFVLYVFNQSGSPCSWRGLLKDSIEPLLIFLCYPAQTASPTATHTMQKSISTKAEINASQSTS